MSMAEIYQNGVERESVKLWQRDWSLMPDRAQVRYFTPEGTLGVDIGEKQGGVDEQDVTGPWPKGSELLGWYWLANPDSDAAYDPGEGLSTESS